MTQGKLKTRPFDAAAYLDSDEAIEAFLDDAFASGEAVEIADALGVVARVKGMASIAEETGLSRTALYRTLSAEGRPELSTLMKVMDALGLRLAVTTKTAA
ncbi:addiction module antidote protein [Brevundimonas sp.]|uniref:addiction module antidote protein n=1 Tax=Brevundimonas sp. TaxID=1871086 RepID=UPI002AB9C7BB|nr:addiction module antidote protein [Brevundimonas sp.]MDZ4362643.1 addiction module antidote protein [Brevundimonas sp.]